MNFKKYFLTFLAIAAFEAMASDPFQAEKDTFFKSFETKFASKTQQLRELEDDALDPLIKELKTGVLNKSKPSEKTKEDLDLLPTLLFSYLDTQPNPTYAKAKKFLRTEIDNILGGLRVPENTGKRLNRQDQEEEKHQGAAVGAAEANKRQRIENQGRMGLEPQKAFKPEPQKAIDSKNIEAEEFSRVIQLSIEQARTTSRAAQSHVLVPVNRSAGASGLNNNQRTYNNPPVRQERATSDAEYAKRAQQLIEDHEFAKVLQQSMEQEREIPRAAQSHALVNPRAGENRNSSMFMMEQAREIPRAVNPYELVPVNHAIARNRNNFMFVGDQLSPERYQEVVTHIKSSSHYSDVEFSNNGNMHIIIKTRLDHDGTTHGIALILPKTQVGDAAAEAILNDDTFATSTLHGKAYLNRLKKTSIIPEECGYIFMPYSYLVQKSSNPVINMDKWFGADSRPSTPAAIRPLNNTMLALKK